MLETEAYSFYLYTIITEVPLWTFPTTPFMAYLTKGYFFFFDKGSITKNKKSHKSFHNCQPTYVNDH